MLTNIMFVTLYVTDQDRALKFYTEVLGMEALADNTSDEGRFLTLGVPGSPVQIILWPRASGSGQPAEVEPGTHMAGIFLESDDLRKDLGVLRARGVKFEQPEPEDYTWGVRITAVDPDGNRLALRQRPGSRDDG